MMLSKGEWLSFEVVINHSVRLKGSKKYHQHPHHTHNFVLIRTIVVVKVIKQYEGQMDFNPLCKGKVQKRKKKKN